MIVENSQPVETDRKYQYLFTVFTPTYNRATTLHRVYESLKAQTFRDFEWLIVDDGSKDNTREVVEQWQQENPFPIRYVYQENGHKHIAFGRGVKESDGELFLTLDSDDYCEPNALERFKYHWDTIPQDQKENFSAVTCLCKTVDGEIVGNRFPFDPTDSDSIEINYRYKVDGEKWGFHRTDVLRQLSYHEELNGIYVCESVYWHEISRKYKTRFVNEALRTYIIDAPEPVVESKKKNIFTDPSMAGLHVRTKAFGQQMFYSDVLNKDINWFRVAPVLFFLSAVKYVRVSFHVGDKVPQQVANIKTLGGKILCVLALPFGYLVYLKDNYRQ
jgi:glycosyltransferase involved in cell wall biosynthesis